MTYIYLGLCILGVVAALKIATVLFRPPPWEFVAIRCSKRARRSGHHQYVRWLLGLKSVIKEEVSASGERIQVEAYLWQFDQEDLHKLATSPDAVAKKPWPFEGGRYSIDMSHLGARVGPPGTIKTWAEVVPNGGVRFIARKAVATD